MFTVKGLSLGMIAAEVSAVLGVPQSEPAALRARYRDGTIVTYEDGSAVEITGTSLERRGVTILRQAGDLEASLHRAAALFNTGQEAMVEKFRADGGSYLEIEGSLIEVHDREVVATASQAGCLRACRARRLAATLGGGMPASENCIPPLYAICLTCIPPRCR